MTKRDPISGRGAGPDPVMMPGPSEPAGGLTDAVRAFLAGTRIATLATLDPDGSPRMAVVWYRLAADGSIVVNSAEGRRWPANLRRDGRVSVSVIDQVSAYRWVGLVGEVEAVIDDQAEAQADIAEMARRYHADRPEQAEALIRDTFRRQQRVTFRIRPRAAHDHLE
jgi:PPOX class probable F420-dependent enzyme